jgi:general L-amino acid transport system permease protein
MSGAIRRDGRVRGIVWQAVLLLAVAASGWFMVDTLLDNLAARRITTGFDFLWSRAGFDISFKLLPYAPGDRVIDALAVGLANTLMVAALAIATSTVLGFALGFLAVPDNPLVRGLVRLYVEVNRNTPLLVQLFFWYGLITLTFPTVRAAQPVGPGILLTNRGLFLPGVDLGAWASTAGWVLACGLLASLVATRLARAHRLRTGREIAGVRWLPLLAVVAAVGVLLQGGATFALDRPQLRGFNIRGGVSLGPELAALLLGLTFYTSAFVAEIVRGSITTIPRGQWDAARALGLRTWPALRLVIAPQAMRIIIPPLASQYINVAKNATLAAAIGFPDFVLVVNTVISQSNQAIEGVLLIVLVYLTINLSMAAALNGLNARLAARER